MADSNTESNAKTEKLDTYINVGRRSLFEAIQKRSLTKDTLGKLLPNAAELTDELNSAYVTLVESFGGLVSDIRSGGDKDVILILDKQDTILKNIIAARDVLTTD